jgi:small subunit ribosomal protein S6
MKTYQLTYLVSGKISRKELEKLEEKVNSEIEKEGGVLVGKDLSIERKTAYPIKKEEEVFLVSLDFNFSPEKIKDLEKKLKEENKILRYLILVKEKKEKPAEKETLKKKKVELKEIEKKLKEILEE